METFRITYQNIMRGSRGGQGSPGVPPLNKSQMAIDFLRNIVRPPPPLREATGPLGPIASRWRVVRPAHCEINC